MGERPRDLTETFDAATGDVGRLTFRPPERWRLVKMIGRGGQAQVWLADDRELAQRVALKVFHRLDDPVARERMRREVRLGRELLHPGLVRLFDLVEMDGPLVAVMEWVPGDSLAAAVSDGGPLAVARVVEIAEQVLEALAYLHGQGVVHRDVKPSNLLLAGDGRVRLGDFGLARRLADDRDLTRTLATVGTPAYMAPEQLRGEEPAPAADLFALGVTLFELLAGVPPFDAGSEFEVADAVLHRRPRPLRSLRPDCPRWLASFIHRLLERAPADRFRDAAAALAAFERRRAVGSPRRRRRVAAAFVTAALALSGGAATMHILGAPAPLDHVRRVGSELVAYDGAGEELWRRPAAAGDCKFVVADLLDSPGREVAVQRVVRGRYDRVGLEVLGRRGRRLASLVLQDGGRLNPFTTTADWELSLLETTDLDGDRHAGLLWAVSHRTWFPAVLGVWAPRAGIGPTQLLINSGRLEKIVPVDLDGEGTEELVVSGLNNPLGYQKVVVLLDAKALWTGLNFHWIASPDLLADRGGGVPAGTEHLFAYVPLGSRAASASLVEAGPDSIVLRLGEERILLDRNGNPEGSPLYGGGWRQRQRFWQGLAVLCRTLRLGDRGDAAALWSGFVSGHPEVLAEAPSHTAAVLLVARAMADGGDYQTAWRLLEETAARIPEERDLLLRAGEYRLIAGDRRGGRANLRRSLPLAPGGRNPYDQFLLLGLDAVSHGDEAALKDAVRANQTVAVASGGGIVEKLRPVLLWAQGRWGDPRLEKVELDRSLPVLDIIARWAALERGKNPGAVIAAVAPLEEESDVPQLARLLHAAAALRSGDAVTSLGLSEAVLDAIAREGGRSYELSCWRPLACWMAAAAALAGDGSPHLEEWLHGAAEAGGGTWYGRRAAAALARLDGMKRSPDS